jgi:hypothetical protein
MASLGSWVHYTQNILQVGRVSHLDPEPVNDNDDPEVLKKQLEARDPYEKRLKLIGQDAKVRGNLPPWVIKYCGDKTNYAQ